MTRDSRFAAVAALVVAASGMASLSSCTQKSEAETQTIRAENPDHDTHVRLFFTKNTDASGSCWYFHEVSERNQNPDLRSASRLTEQALRNEDVLESLKTRASDNYKELTTSTIGAAGSCSGSIASAIALVGAVLAPIPGTRVTIGPVAFFGTLAGLVACGSTGKAALDALWNAKLFLDLPGMLPNAAYSSGDRKEDLKAIEHLRAAIDAARFHGTGEQCSEHPNL